MLFTICTLWCNTRYYINCYALPSTVLAQHPMVVSPGPEHHEHYPSVVGPRLGELHKCSSWGTNSIRVPTLLLQMSILYYFTYRYIHSADQIRCCCQGFQIQSIVTRTETLP